MNPRPSFTVASPRNIEEVERVTQALRERIPGAEVPTAVFSLVQRKE